MTGCYETTYRIPIFSRARVLFIAVSIQRFCHFLPLFFLTALDLVPFRSAGRRRGIRSSRLVFLFPRLAWVKRRSLCFTRSLPAGSVILHNFGNRSASFFSLSKGVS
jgi:hypothetical protein